MNYPDAVLPEGGAQLRAYVTVDADGRVIEITTDLRPSDAAPAYATVSEYALRELTQFARGNADRRYCLQLDFRPDTSAATWRWRPDTTAARCLTNPAATARPLPGP